MYSKKIIMMGIAAVPTTGMATAPLCRQVADKPNVIIILTDDQGYGELSIHGNPIVKTPNLDLMHNQSIRFTDFHAAPMSTPTRGQLLTGIDAVRNGAVNVSSGRTLLKTEYPTIADFFKSAGYATASFGKWHLGDNYPYRPMDRGFDESIWFPSSHISSAADYWENDYFDDVYIHNDKPEQYTGYCTDVFFANGMRWIDEQINGGKPFFLYLPTNAAHEPHNAKQEDIAILNDAIEQTEFKNLDPKFKGNLVKYLALVKSIDDNVGDLYKFLKKRRLLDNTIVVFMTDNGTTFGNRYFNAGMRGAKTMLYEGGHRVPCFFDWKGGNLVKPCDIDNLAEVQDILPTLLDLCHIEYDSSRFDGISLAPALRGTGNIPDRTLFINFSRMPDNCMYPHPYGLTIMRKNDGVVMQGKWRLLVGKKELYNVAEDPGQQKNIYSKHPDVVDRLTKANDEWWKISEPEANQLQRIHIGFDESEVMLTACDWIDVFVDQQSQVKAGIRRNSYWMLYADSAGNYEIELRRWPKTLGKPMTWGDEANVALPIKRAKIILSTEDFCTVQGAPVKVGADCVKFSVNISQTGPAQLYTQFMADGDMPLCGAYYAYITKKETHNK